MLKLSGKKVAERLYGEIMDFLSRSDESPRLLSVVIGDDPAAVSYVRAKGRKAQALGAEFKVLELPGNVGQDEAERALRSKIKSWNPTGVVIERPVPPQINFPKLSELIPPAADVDCQRMDSLGRLMLGKPAYIPATAGAVMEILKHYEIQTSGKDVVVIGRSLTVGLPLSVLLVQKSDGANATVTICHSKTLDLAAHTRRADILVVAAGKPGLVTADMVRRGAVVIDVGTNYVDGKLVGDVDYEGVSEKASAITPVPGGVGPVTTAYLMYNLVKALRERNKKGEQR